MAPEVFFVRSLFAKSGGGSWALHHVGISVTFLGKIAGVLSVSMELGFIYSEFKSG
jgi:hypothetical protein